MDAIPAQPLSRKRPIEDAKHPPAKRPAGPSRPTSAQAAAPTLKTLQAQLDALLAAPRMTEADVSALIDAKLAQQRTQFQSALDELHEVCKVGFTNVQASFEAIGEWRDEVTETFAKIDSWATEVEAKLLAKGPSALPKHIQTEKRRPSHLSSTPISAEAALPCQTPAMPAIGAMRRRSTRISDASEFWLATISEQPPTPSAPSAAEPEAAARPTADELWTALLNHGQEHTEGQAGQRTDELQGQHQITNTPAPKQVKFVSPNPSESDHKPRTPPAAAWMRTTNGEQTPAAAGTLFGTEASAEERFGDALPEEDQTAGEGQLPAWTCRSPAWSRRLR